jgi:hypothetical protein
MFNVSMPVLVTDGRRYRDIPETETAHQIHGFPNDKHRSGYYSTQAKHKQIDMRDERADYRALATSKPVLPTRL